MTHTLSPEEFLVEELAVAASETLIAALGTGVHASSRVMGA